MAEAGGGAKGEVHAHELTRGELAGATFTLAETPLLSSSPLVISPQAGALTAGAVHERPELDDGRLVARRTTMLSLACDHRILYGARAARFLRTINDRLEQGLP